MAINLKNLISEGAEFASIGNALGLSDDQVLVTIDRAATSREGQRIAAEGQKPDAKVGVVRNKLKSLVIDSLIAESQRVQPSDADIQIPRKFKNVNPPDGRQILREAKKAARADGQNYDTLSTSEQVGYVTRELQRSVGAETDLEAQRRSEDPKRFIENDDRRALLASQENVQRGGAELGDSNDNDYYTGSVDFQQTIGNDTANNEGGVNTGRRFAAVDVEREIDASAFSGKRDKSLTDAAGNIIENSFGVDPNRSRETRTIYVDDEPVYLGPNDPYPAEYRYERDENGDVMLDRQGNPIRTDGFNNEVMRSWNDSAKGRSTRSRPNPDKPAAWNDFDDSVVFTQARRSDDRRNTQAWQQDPTRDPYVIAATIARREELIEEAYNDGVSRGELTPNTFAEFRAQQLHNLGDPGATYVDRADGSQAILRRYYSPVDEEAFDRDARQYFIARDEGRASSRGGADAFTLERDRREGERAIAADPLVAPREMSEADIAYERHYREVNDELYSGKDRGNLEGLMGLKAQKVMAPTGDGFSMEQPVGTAEIIDGVAYRRDQLGNLERIPTGDSDPVVVREMENNSIRLERNNRLLETGQALIKARSGKGYYRSAEAEVEDVANSLGITGPEAQARITELQQEMRMGMTASELARSSPTQNIRSGEYPQARNMSGSMEEFRVKGNQVLAKAGMPPIPSIRSVADADFMAQKILEANQARGQGGRPGIAGEVAYRSLGTKNAGTAFVSGPGDTYGDTGLRGGFLEALNLVIPEAPRRDEVVRTIQQWDAAEKPSELRGDTPAVNAIRKEAYQRGGSYFTPDPGIEYTDALGNTHILQSVEIEEKVPKWGTNEYYDTFFEKNTGERGGYFSAADGRASVSIDGFQGGGYRGTRAGDPDLPMFRTVYGFDTPFVLESGEPQGNPIVVDGKQVQSDAYPLGDTTRGDFRRNVIIRPDGSFDNRANPMVYRYDTPQGATFAQKETIGGVAGTLATEDEARNFLLDKFRGPNSTYRDKSTGEIPPAVKADTQLAALQILQKQRNAIDAQQGNYAQVTDIDPVRSLPPRIASNGEVVAGNSTTPMNLVGQERDLRSRGFQAGVREEAERARTSQVEPAPQNQPEAQNYVQPSDVGKTSFVQKDPRVRAGYIQPNSGDPLVGAMRRRIGQPPTRAEVYARVAAKPESELPPVSRPSGAADPGSFVDANTGQRRSYGGTYTPSETRKAGSMLSDPWAEAAPVARAQAPDTTQAPRSAPALPAAQPQVSVNDAGKTFNQMVADVTAARTFDAPGARVIPSVTPAQPTVAKPMEERRPPRVMGDPEPQQRRPPSVGGGGGDRVIDTLIRERRARGGDIYQERQRESQNASNNRRRTGRGRLIRDAIGWSALGAGAFVGGQQIGNMIRDEREQREEQN